MLWKKSQGDGKGGVLIPTEKKQKVKNKKGGDAKAQQPAPVELVRKEEGDYISQEAVEAIKKATGGDQAFVGMSGTQIGLINHTVGEDNDQNRAAAAIKEWLARNIPTEDQIVRIAKKNTGNDKALISTVEFGRDKKSKESLAKSTGWFFKNQVAEKKNEMDKHLDRLHNPKDRRFIP